MAVFDYDESFQQAEYYELLNVLMERWETEIVEFKEAKGGYSEDKIGQYFSAISNEANLKNQQYGWFVLGVSEEHTKHPVGTSFKKGDPCNGVQREHNKKLNNGLPILHKVPPKRDYGRYFCIMAEKGGTSHGGLTEKLSPFFHAKKQEVNAYGR